MLLFKRSLLSYIARVGYKKEKTYIIVVKTCNLKIVFCFFLLNFAVFLG